MNNTTCEDKNFSATFLVILSSGSGVSFIICLLAAIIICNSRLWRMMVYRLSLYQVLAALFLSGVCSFQGLVLLYPPPSLVRLKLCIALSFLSVYFEWMKLLFICWLTFHLFVFAVFYKNMQRLERLYVIVSLFLPGALAAVPLATKTYGLSGSWCWIEEWQDSCYLKLLPKGVIEIFTLWYGPAALALCMASIAMVVMIIVLFRRMRTHGTHNNEQNWRALKQLLPLSIYPVTFIALMVPPMTNRVYSAFHPEGTYWLGLVSSISCVGWYFASGLTLLAHMFVMKYWSKVFQRVQRPELHKSTTYKALSCSKKGIQ